MSHSNTRTVSFLTRIVSSALFSAALGMLPFTVQAASSHHGSRASACQQCGTVVSAHTSERPASHGSGVGIATGAIVGGLLGNQVGGGDGRTLATVAGAVGGGYAGNVIEKRARASTVTQVRVRMSNGSVRTFNEAGHSRWHAGAHVRVVNGALTTRS